MAKLHFNSTEEFESIFKRKSLSVTRSIIQGIEEALQKNKRTALLFEITFDQVDTMYEISLPKSQWQTALESCLEHLHKENLANEEIDCWKLLEAVKVW
jgi:FKBP-type peptidyl-prolyl cis-trans isomerase (trigger factor)